MTITICIGSSCHLKGSRDVVARMQNLVNDNGLQEQVKLTGAFCNGVCVPGVAVTIDGSSVYTVTPETTELFFQNEVLPRLTK